MDASPENYTGVPALGASSCLKTEVTSVRDFPSLIVESSQSNPQSHTIKVEPKSRLSEIFLH